MSRAQRLHYSVQAVILLGLALFLAHLVRKDTLHYYLAPHMEKWIPWCPIALGFMSIYAVYRVIAPQISSLCDCEHQVPSSFFRKIALYGILVFPITLGTLLPHRSLGSTSASTKGFSLTVLNPSNTTNSALTTPISQNKNSNNKPLKNEIKIFQAPDEYNQEFASLANLLYAQPQINVTPQIFSETIGAIELFKHDFIGKPISLTGFVFKDEEIGQSENEFAVGRFLVLCCTADARPFGVLIKPPAGANIQLEEDTWINVTGTIDVELANQQEVISIHGQQIKLVQEPREPYVYTNADAVAAFKELNAN